MPAWEMAKIRDNNIIALSRLLANIFLALLNNPPYEYIAALMRKI